MLTIADRPAPSIRAPLGVGVIVTVTVVTVLSKGPLFLPGAVSDLIGRDIGLRASHIGMIIALYWTGSIAGAYLSRRAEDGGRVEARIGVALMTTAAALVTAGVWPEIGLWTAAVAGGVVYGYTQPHTNFLLVRRCAGRIHGLAFGIKQASIPLATLFCALAVPAIAVPLGWRPLLVVVGLMCAAQAAVLLVTGLRHGTRWHSRVGGARLPLNWHLFALAAAGACGAAVGNSLGGFLISSLTHSGGTLLVASLTAAAGSITAVVVRIVVGWGVDRTPRSPRRLLGWLGWLFLIGAGGTALLTVPHSAAQVIGALLAYGGGWGWAGLLHYCASAAYPNYEGPATAVTQMGVSLGGAVGPLGFGLLVDAAGSPVAWWTMTVVGLAAWLFVMVGGRCERGVAGERVRGRRAG